MIARLTPSLELLDLEEHGQCVLCGCSFVGNDTAHLGYDSLSKPLYVCDKCSGALAEGSQSNALRSAIENLPSELVMKVTNPLFLRRRNCADEQLGGDLKHHRENYIAGWNTAEDWYALRDRLVVGQPHGWQQAFVEFFEARLNLRYLNPIKVLQENGTFQGEGFSIVAIQCSLIELLESAAQGTNYRFARGEKLGAYEYSSSQAAFISFLTERAPFSRTFNAASALDFYVGVRCGVLHEARTKNGWRIWAEGPPGTIALPDERIVYRNNFQVGLLTYIGSYGERLPHEAALQEAFIRKFDALCA
jgi:hypothetical protein